MNAGIERTKARMDARSWLKSNMALGGGKVDPNRAKSYGGAGGFSGGVSEFVDLIGG